LSVTVNGNGSVTGNPAATSCSSGNCSNSLPGGTQVTLTAVPASEQVFRGWSGACSGLGTCTLNLDANLTVTASFGPAGGNVLPLTVNGATCAGGSGNYLNKPCVRVTVCVPGATPPTCQEVDDVLVDTGSYGLRLFKQVLPFTLAPMAVPGGALAECVQYLDGTSHWGPVATADVVLGGEPAIQIPIQVLDAAFGPPPASCPGPDASPATAGINGIVGVGPFPEDCGAPCTIAGQGIYFACGAGGCSGTGVPLASQVVNPVARLPADNNGVIVDLPPVALGGQPSVEGSLILGIDTQANNSSAGAMAYPGHATTGDIHTTLAGTAISWGFLDTGSNGLFFAPPSSLPACPSPNQDWFCPGQPGGPPVGLSATNAGVAGSPSGTVSFEIGNALGLFATGNKVFGELGGSLPAAAGFDWGLPFFLGHPVYVGIGGRTSNLATGPYYAY